MDKDNRNLSTQYSAAQWRSLYFEWDKIPGKLDIKDIIISAEKAGLRRMPKIRRHVSPIGGFDGLPPMQLAIHYDSTSNDLWWDGHDDAALSWPDEGIRFIVDITELVKHTDDRGNPWSPKVNIDVYKHKQVRTVGGTPIGNRKMYQHNWSSYRHDDKWNDAVAVIEKSSRIFSEAVRNEGKMTDGDMFDDL